MWRRAAALAVAAAAVELWSKLLKICYIGDYMMGGGGGYYTGI